MTDSTSAKEAQTVDAGPVPEDLLHEVGISPDNEGESSGGRDPAVAQTTASDVVDAGPVPDDLLHEVDISPEYEADANDHIPAQGGTES